MLSHTLGEADQKFVVYYTSCKTDQIVWYVMLYVKLIKSVWDVILYVKLIKSLWYIILYVYFILKKKKNIYHTLCETEENVMVSFV